MTGFAAIASMRFGLNLAVNQGHHHIYVHLRSPRIDLYIATADGLLTGDLDDVQHLFICHAGLNCSVLLVTDVGTLGSYRFKIGKPGLIADIIAIARNDRTVVAARAVRNRLGRQDERCH